MKKDVRRLLESFQPENYVLDLIPDRENGRFNGTVEISGRKAGKPSKRLTFHQKGLKVLEAQVTVHDKKGDHQIDIARINLQKSYDEVRLHATKLLYPGRYTVRLKFEGKITGRMSGIYPCNFKHNGQDKQLIATQFESHHAREVFPCIDEPAAKATFDLSLVTPAAETVLANTPVKRETKLKGQQSGGFKRTTFETTPKMSVYLLAFVYGELSYLEAKTKDGVLVRTYATPDQIKHTRFALDTAVKCLEFYNDYFGIDYPLPKCDLIALPDFASGAMENWGCITFREQALLVDPKNTSVGSKQWVAMVVAHELAHQWFGNLVTMRWWTDLWLNEGFASWIEYLAVDKLFPEWQMWTQFASDEQQRAFKLDALEYTHPIEVPVHHPDEIRTIFDTISYSKGASVIHMLHNFLTPDVFRKGLQHYLKRHKYDNTDTIDLWQALEEASGKPVKDFMHAWTSQPGFPIVSADAGDTHVELSQERFYINPEQKHQAKTVWPIPLLRNGEPAELMTEAETVINVSSLEDFKLNVGQCGFYRVSYTSHHLERLSKLATEAKIGPLDRLGVLSDFFESAKAGQTKTTDALALAESFAATESDNTVWDIIAGGVAGTRAIMDDEDLRDMMKPFICKLVAKQLKRLGWEAKPNESHFDKLLRPTILGLAAGADHPSVIKETLSRFDNMKNPEDIDPDLRGIIYATAVRKRDDQKTFDKLFAMHEASSSSEERTTIAAALTSFKDPELTKQSIELIKSPSIRLQDAAYWIAYSFSNRFARDAIWTWMTKNWDWLEDNLGSDLSFARFPVYAASGFSDRKFLKKYDAFFKPRTAPAIERAINQGREVITWQAAWRERDFQEVMQFFKRRQAS